MRAIPGDIRAYQERLDAEARPICELLLATIEEELPDADRKAWHAHPVWFFDGNPVVGYDRLKRPCACCSGAGGRSGSRD